MVSVKAWKHGEAGEPKFPGSFDIVQKAVLQVTDIKTNRNKYYAIELHKAAEAAAKASGAKPSCRVFTHYGRTDDLDTNPDSGQKECRYFSSLDEAMATYQSIYRQKTGAGKGYKEVSLAASRIGSDKARGSSAGELDAKTLEKLAKAQAEKEARGEVAPQPKRLNLAPGVQDLVRYLFAEATDALTSTVSARITANGIETPLGILTIGQIEKGEAILADAYKVFQDKSASAAARQQKLQQLSGEFYTVIPHRIGRSREAVKSAVLDSLDAFGRKQETLQLMKDMLNVNGQDGSVLYDAQVDAQYLSLKCDVAHLDKSSDLYRQIEAHAKANPARRSYGGAIKVQNIFQVKRPGEWQDFEAHSASIPDHRLLFHGSGIQNWVGLLSRGILLPKLAVKLGAHRTDCGWLGHGIYFGDVSSTSAAYASPGRGRCNGRKTCFMAVARVALGNIKPYTKITYGLTAPPQGYHSCHGVRSTGRLDSDFYDDEFVIYDAQQQRMEYLVEFTQ